MFETSKPRQFHYTPRFYDPEKEKWEALKKKYADEKAKADSQQNPDTSDSNDSELAYFQNKVRQMDREERHKPEKLGFKDLYRKRKMPTFNYQPRFSGNGTATKESVETPKTDKNISLRRPSSIKIQRRFDIGDPEYLKPVSSGKILIYAALTCLLLYWIFF